MYFYTINRPVALEGIGVSFNMTLKKLFEPNLCVGLSKINISAPQVYSWGSNMCGQLGHVNSPVTVPQQAKVCCREKKKKKQDCPVHRVAVALDRLGALVVCCSSPMACGFGTCPAARATPSSWLTGTACSPSCCTAVSSRSRARGLVKVRGHPAERRATLYGPPCCPSAQRSV